MNTLKKNIKVTWEDDGEMDGSRMNVLLDESGRLFLEDIEAPYSFLVVSAIRWTGDVACTTEKRVYHLSPYDFYLLLYPDINEDAIELRMRGGMLLARLFEHFGTQSISIESTVKTVQQPLWERE